MLKKLSLLISFFILISKSDYVIHGAIEVPESKNLPNNFFVCFDGSCVFVEDLNYVIRVQEKLKSLNVLITSYDNIVPYVEKNGDSKFVQPKLKSGSKYLFYKLALVGSDWSIRTSTCPEEIPLSTLIVPIDVEGLGVELSPVKSLVGDILNLPLIKISGDGDFFKNQILRTCLSLDLKSFHSPQQNENLRTDNLRIKIVI